jgi:hypothetical protein
MESKSALEELLSSADLPDPLENTIQITGKDPVIETSFLAGKAVASALAAQAASIIEIWKMRTGKSQHVSVDVKAAVNSLTGLNNVYQSGHLVDVGILNEPTIGFYPTLDSKWTFILGLFPHLRDGLLSLLNCANNRSAIGEAISKWNAQELEYTIAEHDLSGAMLRTQDEWRVHSQGKALLELPVVDIVKIGESNPEEFKNISSSNNLRPLSGIRAIDMTRLLAGPMAARLLAE